MAIMDLGGCWKLYGYPQGSRIINSPAELSASGLPCLEANVPGNAEAELVHAGLEKDPFFGENLYAFQKYEYYQWWYERTFDVPAQWQGQRCQLRCEGLDTCATVFINGEAVGEAENMLIAHCFDVTAALRCGQPNTVHVCLRSALLEAAKQELPVMAFGNGHSDEYTVLRKPASCFGWDIMPRLPSAGLWRGVYLETVPATRFTQVYIATKAIERSSVQAVCRVRFVTELPTFEGLSLHLSGRCGEHRFETERPCSFVSDSLDFTVNEPQLWWPAGYGPQNLYDVEVRLCKAGQTLARERCRVGFRVFQIEHIVKPGDEGEFLIRCNGERIFAKGSNWVGLDALHSRDGGRVTRALSLFVASGCNLVRCWGGSVYEDHAFFDLCDQYGLMVWQDFSFACASYAPTPQLVKAVEAEAESVIQKLRNHPSLLLWAGDNEVDEGLVEQNYPTYENRYNAISRELLPRMVRFHDPYRFYLPSSPYIPRDVARYDVPEQHNWGVRASFKDPFYKDSTAHFISECGYHGCPAPDSLKRFLPSLSPWLGDPAWRAHSTEYAPKGQLPLDRIGLMNDQVKLFFGDAPDSIELFWRLSQIVQAEADKFFIERSRLQKWRRTGLIWWNMLDGWPQVSDAVVDYYFVKKLAWHYIKRSQQSLCLMLNEPEGWSQSIVLCNDGRKAQKTAWQVLDGETLETLAEGVCVAEANVNTLAGMLAITPSRQALYLLRWQTEAGAFSNHYLAGFPPYSAEKLLHFVEIIRSQPEPFEW